MVNKKICMMGGFAVGKTSLVARYVHSVFSDAYLSTVGVKISKKLVTVDGREITMVLWDMEGKDLYTTVNLAYLRGAMGFLLVADGTRLETLDVALELRETALAGLGSDIPHCLLVNKADIMGQWEVSPERIHALKEQGIPLFCTSAKTGQSIEEAFTVLARRTLQGSARAG